MNANIPSLSTFTNLAANATWTSPIYNINGEVFLNVLLQSNTKGFLTVRWSSDYGNTFIFKENYTYGGVDNRNIELSIYASTLQLVYNNGPTAQTFFSLVTNGISNTTISNALFEDGLITYNEFPFAKANPQGLTGFNSVFPSYYYNTFNVSGGSNSNLIGWSLSNNGVLSIQPLTTGGTGKFGLITGSDVTPSNPTTIIELSCSFLAPDDYITAQTYDFVGHGILDSINSNVLSGIGLGTTAAFLVGNLNRFVCIAIYNNGTETIIPQNTWNVNQVINMQWRNMNTFRFIISGQYVILQWQNVMQWITLHVIYNPLLYSSLAQNGNFIIRSLNVSGSANGGVRCQRYVTRIRKLPLVIDSRTFSVVDTATTTETFILSATKLLNTPPINLKILVTKLRNLCICNTSNNTLLIRVRFTYAIVESGVYTVVSNITFNTNNTLGVLSGVIIRELYIGNNSTGQLDLQDIYLNTGIPICLITAQYLSGSGTLIATFNWDEYY